MRALVAHAGPDVRKGAALNGHELPFVALRVQRELEHSQRIVLKHLAVGCLPNERGEVGAPCSDDKRADAAHVVTLTVCVLRREALVVVRVAAQDQLGTMSYRSLHTSFIVGMFVSYPELKTG